MNRAALTLACCLAVCALFPAAGYAAPEGDATVQIQSGPFTVMSGQGGDGQAFCPPGSRVVGGGVTSTGSAVGTYIRSSGPLDETGLTANLNNGDVGRSWYANVQNTGGSPNTYAATALCSPGSDATIQVASFTVMPGQSGDGQAFCPPGSRVVGGGVTSIGSAVGTGVQVSGPLDETGLTSNLNNGDVGRSWYASVENIGAQNTYASTAICSPGSDATIQVAPFTVMPNQIGSGQAFCPPGSRVVGGGVTSTGPPVATYSQSSGPLDETGLAAFLGNADIGRSWYASLFNAGVLQNTYVSTAICASPPVPPVGPAPSAAATAPASTGQRAAAIKKCKKKKRAKARKKCKKKANLLPV